MAAKTPPKTESIPAARRRIREKKNPKSLLMRPSILVQFSVENRVSVGDETPDPYLVWDFLDEAFEKHPEWKIYLAEFRVNDPEKNTDIEFATWED